MLVETIGKGSITGVTGETRCVEGLIHCTDHIVQNWFSTFGTLRRK